MSTRYEISEGELDVLAITGPEGTRYIDGEEIEARVIRQQSADIAELRAELTESRSSAIALKFDCDRLRAKLAEMVGRSRASRDDLHRALGRTDDTIIQLDHELSLSRLATERHVTHIAQCGKEIKTLRAELAAAVAENAALLAANRDCILHFDAMKLRAEQSEARLSAIDSAPVVAVVREMKRDFASGPYKFIYYDSDNLPAGCTELIAKPAKD